MNILIIGLTSSAPGGMEFHNLGNYIIMEPFINELQKTFPNATIRTSIQMSDEYCKKWNIHSLRDKRFYLYGYYTARKTLVDIFKISLWKILSVIGLKVNFLLNSSLLLKELNDADLIIDFSGDIYGDNATSAKFIESNVELIFARILNKKIAMLMGSPGPFKSIWRQIVAKSNLNNIALLTNRENKSTEFLEYIGINGKHIYSAGCPSVLFKKENDENMRQIFEIEGLNEIRSKPLIGLIICGWNMPEAPYNKWPRSDDEYNYFIKIIDFLIRQKNVDICLMSHQNGTNKAGKLTKQNDHNIIDKLLELIGDKYTSKQLFTLQGLYTAAESKAIISKFDILVSGRIHGAVQGMSQCIPTAIIDYGHEPKAHKLKGFADIYKVGNLIIEPNNYEKSIYVLDELIENSQVYHESLKQRVPEVKKLALKNLSLLESYYNL